MHVVTQRCGSSSVYWKWSRKPVMQTWHCLLPATIHLRKPENTEMHIKNFSINPNLSASECWKSIFFKQNQIFHDQPIIDFLDRISHNYEWTRDFFRFSLIYFLTGLCFILCFIYYFVLWIVPFWSYSESSYSESATLDRPLWIVPHPNWGMWK